MECARRLRDGSVKWVEVCYCGTPLEEERPYWEEYFDLIKVQDAHARTRCKDLNGEEPWACSDCDCTDKLERPARHLGAALPRYDLSCVSTLRRKAQRFFRKFLAPLRLDR